MTDAYKKAGVDISAGDRFTRMIAKRVQKVWPDTADEIGKFAGEGSLPFNIAALKVSVDGVGTKLKIAFLLDRHDTVGYDALAMAATDVLMEGFTPKFVVDYLAVQQLIPDKHIQVIDGLINACTRGGCRLLGGETAELPDMIRPGEYDLSVTCIGIDGPYRLTPKSSIKPGMTVWGWLSKGPGSNGYSLIREVFGLTDKYRIPDEEKRQRLETFTPELQDTLGRALLQPTAMYIEQIQSARSGKCVYFVGHAHITGGGMPGNISRLLPDDCKVMVDRSSWQRPPIFPLIQETGGISDDEMDRVFNQGIQIVSVVDGERVPQHPDCVQIGVVEKRQGDESPVQFTGSFLDT